ncbi:hypothetical protein [Microbacterium sp. 69-7]|uniref:hypothetical protein n=1 Tax=Microbacterium sp. 69-7 TaxID=1895784 RepID=UPI000A5F46CE|nr:hypothetical protein [Microbacterium sp. 69-7]
MTMLDARFAGGSLQVDVADFAGVGGVTLEMPGNTAGMFPDEARALAAALVVAAGAAERPRILRRAPHVDDELQRLAD